MSAPTRAGRALRRSLLKGCVVVIVVAGYSGKRFIYERAQELGIRWGAFWQGPCVRHHTHLPGLHSTFSREQVPWKALHPWEGT